MEAIGAVVGVADVAMRASLKLWSLSGAWRDAPEDLHKLRDDLSRTQRFFAETQGGIDSMYSLASRPGFQRSESHASWRELERLLDQGAAVLQEVEQFIDSLDRPDGLDGGIKELSKRRKIIWMSSSRKVGKLRNDLRNITSTICRLLIAQNV